VRLDVEFDVAWDEKVVKVERRSSGLGVRKMCY
jgi:hypothetical protein